jgi:para-aminobenzoate synthetase component 1
VVAETARGAAVLEIREPVGAFERIEQHLRRAGFFVDGGKAAAGLCADVYLGYGLSDPLRRTGVPAPPEPAALPLAACRVRAAGKVGSTGGSYALGPWERTWTASEYQAAVRAVRAAIAAGEVYQVNLVQHLSAPIHGDPAGLAAALARFSPRHGAPLSGGGWSIVSASPELFLARRGRRVWTMPIKGTRPRGGAASLKASSKDAAEHVMIVDLERNDLGRVCEPGSVRWPGLMQARAMAGVEHLVSTVEGSLSRELGWAEVVAPMFPGGSVTGAPKIAALDHISALEPVGRGAAMGALGTVWPDGDFDLTLTIRTFAIADGRLHFWVGGGVVWDSDPAAEVEESWVKARPLLDALRSGSRAMLRA